MINFEFERKTEVVAIDRDVVSAIPFSVLLSAKEHQTTESDRVRVRSGE